MLQLCSSLQLDDGPATTPCTRYLRLPPPDNRCTLQVDGQSLAAHILPMHYHCWTIVSSWVLPTASACKELWQCIPFFHTFFSFSTCLPQSHKKDMAWKHLGFFPLWYSEEGIRLWWSKITLHFTCFGAHSDCTGRTAPPRGWHIKICKFQLSVMLWLRDFKGQASTQGELGQQTLSAMTSTFFFVWGGTWGAVTSRGLHKCACF